MKKIIFIIAISLLICTAIFAARMVDKTEKVDIGEAKKIVLKGELGVGDFKIISADTKEAFTADISYDERQFEYWVESSVRSNKCVVDIGTEHRRSHNIDTDDNRWDIVLSKKYPIDIDLDIGACEADFELGGIPIEEMNLDVGATEAKIYFSELNPERLVELSIDAGASSFEMYEIGNANFEYFELDGGAGSFELDFSGEYHGTSTIDIDLGLGSADIMLPRNIPVQIHTDGDNWLSSVDIHNNRLNRIKDDMYESDDFDDADDRIILYISVGLGSVDVRFEK